MAYNPRRSERIEPASESSVSRRVQTEGQFRKCDACGASLFVKEVSRTLDVCNECGHHFQINALRRLEITLDPNSFKELFTELESADPLEFKGKKNYTDRARDAQLKT